MESLALIVAIIFLFTVFTGPVALLLSWIRLRILAKLVGIFAAFSGAYWLTVAPFPANTIGLIGIVCCWLVFQKK
jgi:drug/metabolite transporter (DMT)-like permease